MHSWKAQRYQLTKLIKQVSDQWGGDNPNWLNGYAQCVLDDNADSLDEAVRCFASLVKKRVTYP